MKRDRSSVSDRTKHAILAAAAAVIAVKPGASMGEIAEAAQTARSTVHRHYPERAHLIAALQALAASRVKEAYDRADASPDGAKAKLLRLCQDFFEQADLLMAAHASLSQADQAASTSRSDAALTALIERGQRDNTIDPTLPPAWIEQTLWSLLYTAWRFGTTGKISKFEALRLFLGSFERMLLPLDQG